MAGGKDNGITQHLSARCGPPDVVVVLAIAVSLQIALAGNCVYEHGRRKTRASTEKRPQKQPSNGGHKQKRQHTTGYTEKLKANLTGYKKLYDSLTFLNINQYETGFKKL